MNLIIEINVRTFAVVTNPITIRKKGKANKRKDSCLHATTATTTKVKQKPHHHHEAINIIKHTIHQVSFTPCDGNEPENH